MLIKVSLLVIKEIHSEKKCLQLLWLARSKFFVESPIRVYTGYKRINLLSKTTISNLLYHQSRDFCSTRVSEHPFCTTDWSSDWMKPYEYFGQCEPVKVDWWIWNERVEEKWMLKIDWLNCWHLVDDFRTKYRHIDWLMEDSFCCYLWESEHFLTTRWYSLQSWRQYSITVAGE